MSELSRVQKYASMREEIAKDSESITKSEALAPFAKRLAAVDQQYETPHIQKQIHDPLHAKREAYQQIVPTQKDDEITNDYLEQFIEEVKNYNVVKGSAKSTDTKENVLFQAKQVEPTLSVELDEVDDEIVKNVENLMHEITQEQLSFEHLEAKASLPIEPSHLDKTLATMEHSIIEVNEKVLVANKLLRFLLSLLILSVAVILAMGLYWVLISQGLLP